jgi:hypothetical protein
MHKLVVGALLVTVNGLLLSQFTISQPWISPATCGWLLLICNLVGGIRLGYSFAHAYVEEVSRINGLLVDQNSDLVQSNRELLGRVAGSRPELQPHIREGQRA